jgi:DNA-binding MarR family transcriptional regulator
LLIALALMGTATVKRLAKATAADRTTLTRALAPLEREGLVKSAAGDDGRERVLSLTLKGRRRIKDAMDRWEQAQKQVIRSLGGARWMELSAHLRSAEVLGIRTK